MIVFLDLVAFCSDFLFLYEYHVYTDTSKSNDEYFGKLKMTLKSKLYFAQRDELSELGACFVPDSDGKQIILFNKDDKYFRSSWKWIRISDDCTSIQIDEEKTEHYQSLYKDVENDYLFPDPEAYCVGYLIYKHYLITFYWKSLEIFVFDFTRTEWFQSVVVKCINIYVMNA